MQMIDTLKIEMAQIKFDDVDFWQTTYEQLIIRYQVAS